MLCLLGIFCVLVICVMPFGYILGARWLPGGIFWIPGGTLGEVYLRYICALFIWSIFVYHIRLCIFSLIYCIYAVLPYCETSTGMEYEATPMMISFGSQLDAC